MRLQQSISMGWSGLLATTLLLGPPLTFAKKDGPSITSTNFDFIPQDVSYFEDSDVLLFASKQGDLWRSSDAGAKWELADGVPKGKMFEMILHPFDNSRAYYITSGKEHFLTTDKGKTWTTFKTSLEPSEYRSALTFHAGDKDRVIYNAQSCEGFFFCKQHTLYTLDHFKTTDLLREETAGCYWAKTTPEFTSGSKEKDNDRVLCITKGRTSSFAKDYRLTISDEFFKKSGKDIQEFEPELQDGRTVAGIVNMAVVQGYVAVAATAEGTQEMALYVSDDTIKWHRAVFPKDHKLLQKAYTILEGTKYSIQIDVMNTKASHPMGVFLTSNSNGTYFNRLIEHTNRHRNGLVDFEKVTGIQGIVLVNVVDNWKALEDGETKEKKVKSKISFNDGRDFHGLTVDKDELHLHSVTDLSNSGKVFSSPAPGLVMGVGNTGDYLKSYDDGNLYVSDDAGLTWRLALKGPHVYEFGDQGSILVAVEGGRGRIEAKKIKWSINHGKDWSEADLPHSVYAIQLTTTQDSTSLKFILEGKKEKDRQDSKSYIMAFDFEDLHEGKCDKDKDFEKWYARVDDKKEPMCLMGHKQWYNRRKADSDCFVKDEFHDPEVHQEDCPCAEQDFECDFNFVRSEDRKECVKAGRYIIPEGECKDPKGRFKGSSGWRKIPGNTCDEKKGVNKAEPVDRDCEEGKGGAAPPADGKVSHADKSFPSAKMFQQIEYLEKTAISSGSDETIVMRTDKALWYSKNHGKEWSQLLADEDITVIVPHSYNKDTVFFLTPTEKVFYSTDRGRTMRSFKAPFPPSTDPDVNVLNFHPTEPDWLIWIGGRDCKDKATCHTVASYTKDRGDEWRTIQRYVEKCEFIHESNYRDYAPESQKNPEKTAAARRKLIYCSSRTRESNEEKDNPMRLVTSDDFFDTHKVAIDNVVQFATMSEFIVVASHDDKQLLKVDSSVDGQHFADAQFPRNFKVDKQIAYTVLDSSTHSVFLHVTVDGVSKHEYGTIIKSNSNGTSFTTAKEAVNRGPKGYVDFEKSLGLEGIAVANIVDNYKDKNFEKDGKRLKTMITHNDGAEWSYLPPPEKDAEGKSYKCDSNLSKCSLHLHGYTERINKAHTYTSPSAIGLMIATGSVGEYLDNTADTFMSSDGGLTWRAVKKGKYMWEFGDQGSIVVLAKDDDKELVKSVSYSTDEGKTWTDYEFSEEGMYIDELSTVPSDNSRQFLLWGRKDNKPTTINLDFSGLTDKQCKLDEKDLTEGDYYLWTPKHPSQENECLFGHVSQYHRKKPDVKCYNGPMIEHLHDIAKNCTCTRQDYEW